MFETDERETNEDVPEEELMHDSGKRKKIIVGAIIGVAAIACIGGFAIYSNLHKPNDVIASEKEEEKLDPPVISVVGEKFVVGINTELEVQGKVIKSITSDDEVKDVTIEAKNASQKKDVVFGSSKVGKTKNGVPPKTIKFTKEGTYQVLITATDSKGGKTTMTVTFEVGAELLSYVQGIKDWTVEVGSKDVDFMKGITYDKEHIKEITCDASKVDLNKEGSYELTYNIKGIISGQETNIKKTVTVKTISATEAKKEAEKGNQVVTSNNEVRKDSKGNTPTGETNSNTSSNATSTPAPSRPSNNNNDNNGGSSSKPSEPSKPSKPSKPSEPEKPSHTHTWVDDYETRVIPAVTQTINHPEVSHMETVVIQESQYVPNYQVRDICNVCHQDITGFADAHIDAHWVNEYVNAGFYEDNVDMGGYWTDPITEQRKVVDSSAWQEVKVITPEKTERVKVGSHCSGCGATK